MDQNNFLIWLQRLHELTSEQRATVLQRVQLLGSFPKKEKVVGKRDFSDRVLQVLCSTLKRLGAECPSPMVLRKGVAYVSFEGKLPDIEAFFVEASASRVVQDALLGKAIELLYQDIVNWQGVAVSSQTIMQQIHRLPSVLNKSFPGYSSSGYLAKIVGGL